MSAPKATAGGRPWRRPRPRRGGRWSSTPCARTPPQRQVPPHREAPPDGTTVSPSWPARPLPRPQLDGPPLTRAQKALRLYDARLCDRPRHGHWQLRPTSAALTGATGLVHPTTTPLLDIALLLEHLHTTLGKRYCCTPTPPLTGERLCIAAAGTNNPTLSRDLAHTPHAAERLRRAPLVSVPLHRLPGGDTPVAAAVSILTPPTTRRAHLWSPTESCCAPPYGTPSNPTPRPRPPAPAPAPAPTNMVAAAVKTPGPCGRARACTRRARTCLRGCEGWPDLPSVRMPP